MLKLPNSIEPAVMAENILHLCDAESNLDGRVSDLEVTAPKDYSTTETATGQKWIDGNDIYRLVVDELSITMSSAQSTFADTGVQMPENIGVILKCFGLDSNGQYYPMNCAKITVSSSFGIYFPIFSTRNIVTICFEYTKISPTPGRAPEDLDRELTPPPTETGTGSIVGGPYTDLYEPEPEVKKTTKKKTTK